MDESVKILKAQLTWSVVGDRVSFYWGDDLILGIYRPEDEHVILISEGPEEEEDEDRSAMWNWIQEKIRLYNENEELDGSDQESGD